MSERVKTCRGPCGLTKPIECFAIEANGADGHKNRCKLCSRKSGTHSRGSERAVLRAYNSVHFPETSADCWP